MGGYLGILTGVFAVAGIAAIAWAGLQSGNMKNLRDSNEDLRKQRDDQKSAREEAERDRDQERAARTRAEADVMTLSKVITGEVHLVALADKLDEHHDEARVYWRESLDVLRRLSGGNK